MDGVDFEPALVDLSFAEGSMAGAEIRARVPGIGVGDGEKVTAVVAAVVMAVNVVAVVAAVAMAIAV